jgi:hypothetical protein
MHAQHDLDCMIRTITSEFNFTRDTDRGDDPIALSYLFFAAYTEGVVKSFKISDSQGKNTENKIGQKRHICSA